MLANFVAQEMRHPHTRAEYEGLRVDGGEAREGNGDGSNYHQLADGLLKRYGIAVELRNGPNALGGVPVGAGVGVQGLYSALPLRLRVTRFGGGHSVFAVRKSIREFWLLDPLRNNGVEAVVATLEELEGYYRALGGAMTAVAYPYMDNWKDRMIKFNLARYKAVADTPVHESMSTLSPRVTKIPAGTEFTSLGVPMDRTTDATPYLMAGWRAVLITTGALDAKIAPKVGYVRTDTITGVATSGDWDQAVLRALGDITFRGEKVVTVQDPALVSELDTLKTAAAAWSRTRSDIIKLLGGKE